MTSTGYHQARTADLTSRQREVLALIAKGHTNAQIAEQLGVSLDGAKWHVREILSRLDVETREEAAAWWNREQAPWRRVAQGFGFGALPAIAGVVGATAVVVVAVVAAVVLIASLDRGGDAPVAVDPTETPVADETPTPEIVATPTLTPEEDEFLAFAREVDEGLRQGDTSLLTDRVILERVVCTEENSAQGFPDSLPCEFIGDEFDVFLVGTGTHGGITRVEPGERVAPWDSLLAGDAALSDGFGSGEARVFAAKLEGNQGESGPESSMMLTAILPANPEQGREEAARVVQEVFWVKSDGEWRVPWMTRRPFGAGELQNILQTVTTGEPSGWKLLETRQCESAAVYERRTGGEFAVIGPVALSLPATAANIGVIGFDSGLGRFSRQLLMQVDADAGTVVTISGIAPDGTLLSFDHRGVGDGPGDRPLATFELGPEHYTSADDPAVAVVPGNVFTETIGCQQAWVTVDGTEFGPFGYYLWPPVPGEPGPGDP